MKLAAVAYGNYQRVIVKPRTMRLDMFLSQIGIIVGGRSRLAPDIQRLSLGIIEPLVFFCIALAPHGFYFRPVRGFFGGGKFATNICPPRLLNARSPVAESPGRDAVAVQDIPAGVITAFAITRKAP